MSEELKPLNNLFTQQLTTQVSAFNAVGEPAEAFCIGQLIVAQSKAPMVTRCVPGRLLFSSRKCQACELGQEQAVSLAAESCEHIVLHVRFEQRVRGIPCNLLLWCDAVAVRPRVLA